MNIYEEAKCIRKNKANYHGTQSHIPLVLNRGFTNIPLQTRKQLRSRNTQSCAQTKKISMK